MNNYIVLDGKKYATGATSWRPVNPKPHTERYTLLGALDLTYGAASPQAWEGDIHAPVTARDTDWGTITDLTTTLAKKTSVTFIDHDAVSNTAHCLGTHERKSFMNKWDDNENVFLVSVRIVIE